MPLLLDFESRSRADIKRVGGRRYWEHPSTEALCCVLYDTDTGELSQWLPGDPCPVRDGQQLAAHNAIGFDRFAAARLGWRALDAGPRWIDTSQLARTAGLPGGADKLGARWLGVEKDKEGSRFTKALSRPSRAKKRLGQLPDVTPEVQARVLAYCSRDVEIMAHGWDRLSQWLDLEPDIAELDQRINDRGVCFDTQLARRLLECDARNVDAALAKIAARVGWTAERVREVASSPKQFADVTGSENAQADTIDLMIAQRHPWAALAEARQAIASIARGKLEAGLAMVSDDGRLRDMHVYYGAHTGRFSGRGIQLQNMPRPTKRFETWGAAEIAALAEAVLAGRHIADAEEIDLLLRACIHARPGHVLTVCDFAGIEARANAFFAHDHAALDLFRAGKVDPYRVMAALIFGVRYEDIPKEDPRRTVGKIAELAAGYGMGAEKFEWTAWKQGRMRIADVGVSAKTVIDAWRRQHAPIVRFWRDLEEALLCAAAGVPASVGPFEFCPGADGRDVACVLPSGRPVVYNGVHLGRNKWGKAQASYLGRDGRKHLYGGLICENVIQASCRDLLTRAMLAQEDAGLNVVLHVHDETVCEVPISAREEALALQRATMLDLPEWARGFPIGVTGHIGARYRK